MLLTEITDTEPLGLQLLRNLFTKGVSIQLDILDEPRLLIRHFFSRDENAANSYISNVYIESIDPTDSDGAVQIWADNGIHMTRDYVLTTDPDFDNILTLEKHNHQWVLTNASH
jgi:hypothetical protein